MEMSRETLLLLRLFVLLPQAVSFYPGVHFRTPKVLHAECFVSADRVRNAALSLTNKPPVHDHSEGAALPLAYDAEAIALHFNSGNGAAQLRSRVAHITKTFFTLFAGIGRGIPEVVKSGDWSAFAPAVREATSRLGPTAIKLGQAAANRPDLVGVALADELRLLQDSVPPFSTEEARQLIRQSLPHDRASEILASLPEEPVAAASLSQVYRVELDSQVVAVKVLRPDARETVAMDALLARRASLWAKSLNGPDGSALLKPALVRICDEFFSRLFEEMDLDNEMKNIDLFTSLYGEGGSAISRLRRTAGGGEIVLPIVLPWFSGGSVLTMTWIDGQPLTARGSSKVEAADLPIIRFGIEATLSQLIEEGVMHADPHGGNLLRPSISAVQPRLAYLDFGLVSTVPLQVREGLCCAVAHFIFDRDYGAVASLFEDLMIIPKAELANEATRTELRLSLERMADKVLIDAGDGELPRLAFDELLSEFASLAPRFAFELPPYFLNNARALATLEGMAKSADPDYDCLQSIYPFALRRLLADPRGSPVLRKTLVRLTHDEQGRLDRRRLGRLLRETARFSKRSRRRIIWDAARSPGGRAFVRNICMSWCRRQVSRLR